LPSLLFSQDTSAEDTILRSRTIQYEEEDTTLPQRAILAMTTEDYPVTPGDIYTLTYLFSQSTATVPIYIENDYTVNLTIFGKINARGLTFNRLKKMIEERVSQAYPGSSPKVIIQATGLFQVFVKGEVPNAGYVSCWGLTRLSDIIQKKKTPYTSIRNIEVVSSVGTKKSYNLFLAQRRGYIEQDPYIKPGDTIILHKYNRQVTIQGEVRRPGTYQLLEGEELKELITEYADGFTKMSDPSQIAIKRYDTEEEKIAETYYINATGFSAIRVHLKDVDTVVVPQKTRFLLVVFFEGAVGEVDEEEGEKLETSRKLQFRFLEGQTLSSFVQERQAIFSPKSDLENAHLIRRGENAPIPVDLKSMIYNPDYPVDFILKPHDTIIVPFRQFFITVGGSVYSPGRYPYIPDRTAEYYINLAGGRDPKKTLGNPVKITTLSGKIRQRDEIIEPEDRIFVPPNNPLYHIERVSGIIGTVLGVGSLVIGILNLIQVSQ